MSLLSLSVHINSLSSRRRSNIESVNRFFCCCCWSYSFSLLALKSTFKFLELINLINFCYLTLYDFTAFKIDIILNVFWERNQHPELFVANKLYNKQPSFYCLQTKPVISVLVVSDRCICFGLWIIHDRFTSARQCLWYVIDYAVHIHSFPVSSLSDWNFFWRNEYLWNNHEPEIFCKWPGNYLHTMNNATRWIISELTCLMT